MRDDRQRRLATDETGQVLLLTALAMVMLLVMVAFTVDIGKAYLVQRQLQASVDAAALAGAQHLPEAAPAVQVAEEYGPKEGMKNAVTSGRNVTTTVTTRCIKSAPGCSPTTSNYNAVNVRATTDVSLLFARVLGIEQLTVRASATACSPCSAKPLDIMLVLDRTGSMCQFAPGQNDPSCTDLNNAKNGIRTFLSFMDPTLDYVGLAVFPPALDRSFVARCPYTPWRGTSNPNPPPSSLDGSYFAYDAWWPEWDPDPRGATPSVYAVASLSSDYLVESSGEWILNPSSALIQRLGCANGAGSTSYAFSIEEAQHELDRNGRGDIQDVIVFLSDGAANTSPPKLPTGHWANNPTNFQRPCGTGVESAARVKGTGTIIYSIGYDLDGLGDTPERCLRPASNGHQGTNPEACGSWGCTAYDAIRAIASEPANFYNKPDPGELRTIFTRIAADLQRPAARLVDDNIE